ncbi:MAG: type I-A CRISPR-associated protein Cas7/Csa2 [Candidatus Methanomethylicia archaeon]
MVYISFRGRIWLQAEAANMVESVGNYVKHRRVPVLVKEENSYLTFFVPAISGESIAHCYQTILSEELLKLNEDVCDFCKKGLFIKSTNAEVYREAFGKNPPKAGKTIEETMKAIDEIEQSIVSGCGVEDIGGFLYAENPNVKRTSNFFVGYMIPVREVLKGVSIDPQLHSRYALGTKFIQAGAGVAGQMIYYVEVSSAVFNFSFDLDTKFIGRYTFHSDNYGKPVISDDKIKKRIFAALNALQHLLIEFPVGAKRTRFNPSDIRWESLAIAISDDVWTIPSSFTQDYINRGIMKREKVNYNTVIYTYSEEKQEKVKWYSTPEHAIIDAINDAKGRVS